MTENKEALELRNRLRPVAEKHAGEMLRDLIGPASDTARRVATDHLLSFAQTVATPPAQNAMRKEKASGIARPETLDQACARVTKATIAESVEAIGNAFNQKFGTPQPESVEDVRAALEDAIEALKPFAAAVYDWEGGWIGIYEEHVSRAAQVVAKHGDGRS